MTNKNGFSREQLNVISTIVDESIKQSVYKFDSSISDSFKNNSLELYTINEIVNRHLTEHLKEVLENIKRQEEERALMVRDFIEFERAYDFYRKNRPNFRV